MSTLIMAACWPLQMPPTPKAVLVSLADNANDAGECWPSIATICERTCLGRTAVIEAIKWLEANDYVQADRSNGRHSRYRITTGAEVAKPVRQPNRSASRTGSAGGPNQSASRTAPVRQADTNRQEPSRTVNGSPPADAGAREPTDPGQGSEPPPTPAGDACRRMHAAGCTRVNPSHPDLLAALAEGVTPEALADTAAEGVAAGKPNPFAWAIATARGRHADGAKPVTTSTGVTRHASDQPRESLVDRAASRAARIFAEHGFDTAS